MTTKQRRPYKCEKCHSTRIVSIIEGHPDREFNILKSLLLFVAETASGIS